jgi:hypothetical protein
MTYMTYSCPEHGILYAGGYDETTPKIRICPICGKATSSGYFNTSAPIVPMVDALSRGTAQEVDYESKDNILGSTPWGRGKE